jgi:CRP-like cAMP-binding protein
VGYADLSDCVVEESDCILEDGRVRELLTENRGTRIFDYQGGDSVFEAKKAVVGFYLICQGVVKEISPSTGGETVTLNVLMSGDLLFGDDFFLDKNYRETTAKSVTETKVLMIEKELFPELMKLAGERLGRKAGENMKRLRRKLELKDCSVLKNTAFWIAKLMAGSSSSFSISNKELSDIVGCSPVTMSRKLRELQEKGMIEKNGQDISIENRDKMADLVDCKELP